MGKEQFIFHQVFGNKIPRIEDFSPQDRIRILGELTTRVFDTGVDFLRQERTFPNQEINKLMALFWNLVENKITPAALAPAVPSLSFWCEKRGIEETAFVLVPADFAKLCKRNPTMQLGALVFVASQARDYYSNRFYKSKEMEQRALVYEAEFLLTTQKNLPGFIPNEYQRNVLNFYPHGLESLSPELRYQSMPFISARAS